MKPLPPRGPRSWSPSPAQANWIVRRQPIALDLGASAERVALALHDQRRAAQLLQMRRAQVLRLARRMERVAEAHQPVDHAAREQLVGGEAGDAAAHRLAADEQLLPAGALLRATPRRRVDIPATSFSARGGGRRFPPSRRAAI